MLDSVILLWLHLTAKSELNLHLCKLNVDGSLTHNKSMCTGALGIEAYDWLLNSSIASLFVRPPVNRYAMSYL